MLGRASLPAVYVEWNRRWGAPFGHPPVHGVGLRERFDKPREEFGPFGFQPNSDTRTFEYPWAYFTADFGAGMRILEAGGGTSGLQFVLAQEGCQVVNVDPGIDSDGGLASSAGQWRVTEELHQRLNRLFGTDVRLLRQRLQDADLEAGSFDRVLCLSVLEHLDHEEARGMLRAATRLLAPGGLLLMTVDLFLDLSPFGLLPRNTYGTNVDLYRLVKGLDLRRVHGDPRELHGFPAFDRDRIVRRLSEFFVSPRYPVMSQALVLRRLG
jgi:SAM-dependent methyltransferase